MYPIKNKRIGTQLYGEGYFGNTLRQWLTCAELKLEQTQPKHVVLRQRLEQGGGICIYGLTIVDALFWFDQFTHGGESALYFSEQLPHQPQNIIFQGEYLSGDIEALICSDAKMFHRDAMLVAEHYTGASCRVLLKQYLDNSSYENLMNLADAYPYHVIEFTVADEPIGHLGLNTIIWEVRRY